MNKKGEDRTIAVKAFFIIGALLLIGKAAQLQVFDKSYQAKARATTVDKIVQYPSRGLILDREGHILVNNNAMYDLKVTYKQVPEDLDTLKFCKLLDISKEEFISNLEKDWRSGRYSKSVPYTFMSKINAAICSRFVEHIHEFPGFFVQLRNVRSYPYSVAPHVLGYMNEVNQNQIEKSKGLYSRGDYIGVTGLEAGYERVLRGNKGVQYVLKDNLGREVDAYKNGNLDSLANSGADLVSTIDLELQQYAENLLKNKTGSIVAIEPATGEILSMVSAPFYNPNLLTINRERGRAYRMISRDSLRPFFDRSIAAKYPPGSIFKPLVALIAMQEGILNPNRGIKCNSGYYYNGKVRKCHAHPYPGNVQTAIAHSCNAYFFQVFRDVVDRHGFYNPHPGLDTFAAYTHHFGLGEPLGIDIPGEMDGNVPDSRYYDKLYPPEKGKWTSPTIMSVGIGQGEIQMTTVQMANLAAIIANRGWYIAPHLLKQFQDGETITTVDEKYQIRNHVPVEKKHFIPVIDGMEGCVLKGTATAARVPGIDICGKTGTSQNPHGEDHSVFFAFAPKEKPEIAIAVYVEHGRWGATYAAPIASLMIEKYLNDTIADNRKYLEKRMLESTPLAKP